jgi:hypothetical protein
VRRRQLLHEDELQIAVCPVGGKLLQYGSEKNRLREDLSSFLAAVHRKTNGHDDEGIGPRVGQTAN